MKTIDQTYRCQIPGQASGDWQLQCHLCIFQPHPHTEVQTVMITDMAFEVGWFVPYVVERLIDQVVDEFQLNPATLVWIEHYTPDYSNPTCADFSQVTFEWQNGQAANPRWFPITAKVAQALFSKDLQLLTA